METKNHRLVTDGDTAVRRCRAEGSIRFTDRQATAKSSANYLDVLRRQADGSWKIVWHAWSPAG